VEDSRSLFEGFLAGQCDPPPLWEFIVLAAEKNRDEVRDQDAVRRGDARFHTPLWTWIWCLKGHPDLSGRPAEDAYDEVLSTIEEAGETIDAVIGDLGGVEVGDVWAEFVNKWDRVKNPPGAGHFARAVARAQECPLDIPFGTETFAQFVSVAGWLQVLLWPEPIFIPIQTWAVELGCSTSAIGNYRQLAAKYGFLVLDSPYDRGRRRAAYFRFDVSRFDVLERAVAERGAA
jgi:hypothetical protein